MTPEKFLETYAAPYCYGDAKAAISSFLEEWRKAATAAAAKSDPYHGKSETLVLPERKGFDRGINRERK